MCAPIALAGFQLASTLASGAAEASQARYQAKLARLDASEQARAATANAEFRRADADRASASERARQSASGVDPQSESVLASLAQHHADRTGPALDEEYNARLALYRGEVEAQKLRRRASSALSRSLLSGTGILASSALGGNAISIPG